MTINPISGEIIWNSPQIAGKYVFALKVSEYSKGIFVGNPRFVGSVIRDFLIVIDSLNATNYFDSLANWNTNANGEYEYKITPGTDLQLSLIYKDSIADSVILSAFGEVFNISNPASFTTSSTQNQISGSFTWTPDTSNIRNHPYIVTFRGKSYIDSSCNVQQDVTLMIYVDAPVSVENKPDPENNLLIYPNPTTQEITVQFDLLGKQDISINLINILGQNVYSELLKNQSGKIVKQLNFSKLPKGIYLLQIMGNDKIINAKIIIQ